MAAKYQPGDAIRFPWTGGRITYVITAVDEQAQTVTFALPFDLEDCTTETFADLDAVDVEVSR